MRKIIDCYKDWLFVPQETQEEKVFSETQLSLPFLHKIDDMPKGYFKRIWRAHDEDEGMCAYLQFSGITADIKVLLNDNLVCVHSATHAAFTCPLLLDVKGNEEYEIKVEISPLARKDGFFAFSGMKIIVLPSSHFNVLDFGEGVFVDVSISEKTADISIKTEVVRPNNYDIVSYSIIDESGHVVASLTAKPTSPNVTFHLESFNYWDGQSGPALYKIKADLLRDSFVLDELETVFGIREIELKSEGFLYLNGFKLPLNGIELSDCSSVKSDLRNIKLLDVNSLMSEVLPSKTNLIDDCDKSGALFWFKLPNTGDKDKDINALKEFLLFNRNHPSFAAVVCNNSDEDYFEEFYNTVKETAPHIIPAIEWDIDEFEQKIPDKAGLVVLNIPCKTSPESYISFEGRFIDYCEKYPQLHFAVRLINALKTEITADESFLHHQRLWQMFCNKKGLIAYFAGNLSEEKISTGKKGLTSSDRLDFYDEFYYYRAQFSSSGFVKICKSKSNETSEKLYDLLCITNRNHLRLLVNEKDKNYKPEKVSEGIYIFKQIKLKRNINILEVSAGDECDSIEIIRS